MEFFFNNYSFKIASKSYLKTSNKSDGHGTKNILHLDVYSI